MKTFKKVVSILNGHYMFPYLMVVYKGKMITTNSEYPREVYQRHYCDLEWARLNYDLIYNKCPRIPLVTRNYERVVIAC